MIAKRNLAAPSTWLAGVSAVLMAATMSLGAAPAVAQTVTMQRVGPFTIDKINEKGRFDRCAATLKGKPGMLRIAQNLAQKFSVSTPPVPVGGGPLLMTFNISGGVFTFDAVTNGQRAWATIDPATLGALMKTKKALVIDVGKTRFNWPIGATSMEDVMNAVDSCVAAASGNQ